MTTADTRKGQSVKNRGKMTANNSTDWEGIESVHSRPTFLVSTFCLWALLGLPCVFVITDHLLPVVLQYPLLALFGGHLINWTCWVALVVVDRLFSQTSQWFYLYIVVSLNFPLILVLSFFHKQMDVDFFSYNLFIRHIPIFYPKPMMGHWNQFSGMKMICNFVLSVSSYLMQGHLSVSKHYSSNQDSSLLPHRAFVMVKEIPCGHFGWLNSVVCHHMQY